MYLFTSSNVLNFNFVLLNAARSSYQMYLFVVRIIILFISSFTVFFKYIKIDYYSFKIFPRFWLAKSTRLIHHNQLLMTKFGRNLTLTRKWRQKCSFRRLRHRLPRRPGDEVELFWLWTWKNGGHFTFSKREN